VPASGLGQAVTIFAKSRKNAAILPSRCGRRYVSEISIKLNG